MKNRYALLMAGILSVALLTGCTAPGTPAADPPAEDTSTAEVTQPEETVEPLDAAVRTQYNASGDIDIIVEASGGVAPYTYQWQLAWIVAMTETDATWSDWEDEPGATDPVYTVPVTDGFQCRCIVTDSAGNSVTVAPDFSVEAAEAPQEPAASSQEPWEKAYLDFLVQDVLEMQGQVQEDAQYYLLYLNNDAIPELYINYGFTYAGAKICTWDGDQVNFVNVGAGDELFYYEKGTCFHVSGGRMDHYYDVVFQIKNGRIQEKVRGEWEVLSYEPEEVTYTWNGKNVSESDYQASLTYMFDDSGAKQAEDQGSYSYDEVRNVLS